MPRPGARSSPSTPPSVGRRLLALAYEAVLLFGVVFFAGLAFALATGQRDGLVHRGLLAAWIALVVGAYFVWFWTHGGQTLPMKTWRLRIEAADARPLGAGRALARYLLGWLWFLPPLALHPLFGLSIPATLVGTAAWFALWAASARLHPARQFPHDRLAGTRVVALPR